MQTTLAKKRVVLVTINQVDGDLDYSKHLEATGGNTGNLVFAGAIRKYFPDAEVATVDELFTSAAKYKNFDMCIWVCANQLGSHLDFGGWTRIVEEMDIPAIIVGIGAQAPNMNTPEKIPLGTLQWLKAIESRKPSKAKSNISTRGPFSSSVLKENGFDSVAITCPSIALLHNFPNFPIAKEVEKLPFAITAGHTGWLGYIQRAEKILFNSLNSRQGQYILQSDQTLFDAVNPKNEAALTKVHKYLSPDNDLAEFAAEFRRVTKSYVNVNAWQKSIEGYQFVIGTRIHGVIMGRCAGVPSLLITTDSRTQELAISTNTPSISVQDFLEVTENGAKATPTALRKIVWDRQPSVRDQSINQAKSLAKFRSFFISNGLHDEISD